MKKSNILFILSLLMMTTSCSESTPSDPKAYLINKILNNASVEIKGQENISYPSDLSFLDSHTVINLKRDYQTIIEKDGSKTPLMRENNNGSFTTYMRGAEGQAIIEMLNSKNEVVSVDYLVNGKSVLFNEIFVNPFEYIDTSDITDDYYLDNMKASYLIESYTGYQYAVKQAKFIVDNNIAKELQIEFQDITSSIYTSTQSVNISSSLELSISFDYNTPSINHLSPRQSNDASLKKAFKDTSNFTLTFESTATSETCIAYFTETDVYFHKGIDVIGSSETDIYYKKHQKDDLYDKYIYHANTGSFMLEDFDISKDAFYPSIENISYDILLKESNNTYYFDNVTSKYGLEAFILPLYSVNTGLGLNGTLKLDDGHISQLNARFNQNSPFMITQNYYHYGTTTIPSWLDCSTIA